MSKKEIENIVQRNMRNLRNLYKIKTEDEELIALVENVKDYLQGVVKVELEDLKVEKDKEKGK